MKMNAKFGSGENLVGDASVEKVAREHGVDSEPSEFRAFDGMPPPFIPGTGIDSQKYQDTGGGSSTRISDFLEVQEMRDFPVADIGLSTASSSLLSSIEPVAPNIAKVLCSNCGYHVNPVGHENRCRVPTEITATLRRYAWIGDSVWEVFVRSVIVAENLPLSDAVQYVKNETLASHFTNVQKLVNLNSNITTMASVHSKSTYVEAAIAVSAVVRAYVAAMAGPRMVKHSFSLLSPKMVPKCGPGTEFLYQPNIDGYCYLALFSSGDWDAIASKYGAFPSWNALRYVVGQSLVTVHLKVRNGLCHVSTVPLPGFVKYVGLAVNIPLDGEVRVGGTVVVRMDMVSLNQVVHSSWGVGAVSDYEVVKSVLAAFLGIGKTLVCPGKIWNDLVPLFSQKPDHGANPTLITLDVAVETVKTVFTFVNFDGPIGVNSAFKIKRLVELPDSSEFADFGSDFEFDLFDDYFE